MKFRTLLPIALFIPFSAMAQTGSAILTVDFVSAASALHPDAAAKHLQSYGFDSTTPLGSCPQEQGKVYFEADPSDNVLTAVLLTAQVTGKKVQIYWDDNLTNSRYYCILKSARILQNTPP